MNLIAKCEACNRNWDYEDETEFPLEDGICGICMYGMEEYEESMR